MKLEPITVFNCFYTKLNADFSDRIKRIGVSSGFQDKPGNKVKLGTAESGKPTGIIVEKNSGIRISRPKISQHQLMVGIQLL